MTGEMADWLIFTIEGQRCALSAGRVRQVMRPPPAARVPGASPHCLGLVAWQGRLVTVVDAAAWLLQRLPQESSQERLVIWAHDGRVGGLRVESVVGLQRLPADAILPLQNALPAPWNAVSGLLCLGEEMAAVFEPAALFAAGLGETPASAGVSGLSP